MFEWLESTSVALWVGESLWGYPIMLGLHVVGLAIVVGLFVMRDLRLMGLFDGISYESLDKLRPLGWTGFIINAVSGDFPGVSPHPSRQVLMRIANTRVDHPNNHR